jgi:uncharacterized lipoprotein NlpE involved in copper resistance
MRFVRQLPVPALALGLACTARTLPDQRGTAATASDSTPVRARIAAPVTYAASDPWPCADCPGILPTLTLFPDSTFRLRRVYQDRPARSYERGRWSVAEAGRQLVLDPVGGEPERFAIISPDTLRQLDRDGRPTRSPFDFTLVRSAQVDSIPS